MFSRIKNAGCLKGFVQGAQSPPGMSVVFSNLENYPDISNGKHPLLDNSETKLYTIKKPLF